MIRIFLRDLSGKFRDFQGTICYIVSTMILRDGTRGNNIPQAHVISQPSRFPVSHYERHPVVSVTRWAFLCDSRDGGVSRRHTPRVGFTTHRNRVREDYASTY